MKHELLHVRISFPSLMLRTLGCHVCYLCSLWLLTGQTLIVDNHRDGVCVVSDYSCLAFTASHIAHSCINYTICTHLSKWSPTHNASSAYTEAPNMHIRLFGDSRLSLGVRGLHLPPLLGAWLPVTQDLLGWAAAASVIIIKNKSVQISDLKGNGWMQNSL